jgi:hypothetical protein
MKEVPFKSETRKYPVDFAYPRESKYTAIFQVPDGYTIAEIPEAVNLVLPDKKARFTYKVVVNGNVIQVASTFEIPNVVFGESDYAMLKQFYNQVMLKQNESLILKKSKS